MEIISGISLADQIKANLKTANTLVGISPCLAIIDVGENQENKLYIGLKEAAAQAIGGTTRTIQLARDAEREEVLEKIRALNCDPAVSGILLQLPLPAPLETYREDFLEAIAPHKDVDGFCPRNRGLLIGAEPDFISCAALACMDVSLRYKSPLADKKILLVGNSFDVIQPLALMFIKVGCEVSVIPDYYPAAMQDIDIAIIENGSPQLVNQTGVKPGALLIDAGFHWHQERVCGNIDREALGEVEGYLLPVPGGMGPLLIAQLMVNLSQAAQKS